MQSELYKQTRSFSELLCSPLMIEDYIPQSATFASPPKWHLAHTTWFFETFILKPFYKNYKEYHPEFNFLFNSYYNALGDRALRNNRGLITRPSVEEVYKYRAYVDRHMLELINSSQLNEILDLLEIGINHEQQHQELLLTDLKYTFSLNPNFPVYKQGSSFVDDTNQSDGYVEIQSGVYDVGYNGSGFSFDNEHGRHKTYLTACKISESLVTNAEFLEFIEDEGYLRHELWLDEGWAWVNENNLTQPLYWHKIDGRWSQFTLGGMVPLDGESILAHVSHYEAAAFAEWKGMRLPTEFEWEIASDKFQWGSRWEHTSSAYSAYPGYKRPKGAVGEYNGKFMINQMVLRGASNATPAGHSRKTYRNFFHPNMQWQFTGIRLAANE